MRNPDNIQLNYGLYMKDVRENFLHLDVKETTQEVLTFEVARLQRELAVSNQAYVELRNKIRALLET